MNDQYIPKIKIHKGFKDISSGKICIHIKHQKRLFNLNYQLI